MNPICEFNYRFPIDTIKKEFEKVQHTKKELVDPIYGLKPGFWFFESTPLLKTLARDWLVFYNLEYLKDDIDYWVHFLWFEANAGIDFHIDSGEIYSAINCVIQDTLVPIKYHSGSYYYTNAALDILTPHSVPASSTERLLFRITFRNPNITYKVLCEKITNRDRSIKTT
jgi:hypothetical protein